MRVFLLRLLGADEDAEKLAAALREIARLELKISVLQDEKRALRESVQHWRNLYRDLPRAGEPE